MLNSKQFQNIESALRFANDFTNKIIPISFVSLPTDNNVIGIILIYEAVEVSEDTDFNLLVEAYLALTTNTDAQVLIDKLKARICTK